MTSSCLWLVLPSFIAAVPMLSLKVEYNRSRDGEVRRKIMRKSSLLLLVVIGNWWMVNRNSFLEDRRFAVVMVGTLLGAGYLGWIRKAAPPDWGVMPYRKRLAVLGTFFLLGFASYWLLK